MFHQQCVNEEEIVPLTRARDTIDLGLFHTLAKCLIGKDVSKTKPITAIRFAQTCKIVLSSLDTISDVSVALTLCAQEEYGCAGLVLAIDYLPSWQVLFHGLKSPAWKRVNSVKEKLLTCMILAFSPFASTLFKLRFLSGYSTKSDDLFNFHHQNDRVSELITSSVESPLQLVLMMLFMVYGKLPMPWEATYTFQDDQGNCIYLGAVPALFSLTMSLLSIIISSMDVSESKNWKENIVFASYAFCNGFFRVGSMIILLALFRDYTLLGLFPCLAVASTIAISRFDPVGRKNFSSLTTFLVGLFLPVAVSAEPQKAQYPQRAKASENQMIVETNENRMSISGKISLFTLPIIFLFDLILLSLLLFTNFKLPRGLILGMDETKDVAINILQSFLLPTGIAAILSAYILSRGSTRKANLFFLVLLSTVVLLLAVFTPVHVLKGIYQTIKVI